MATAPEGFNANETKLICCMMEALRGQLDIDWDLCASKSGHKDGNSARNQWNKLKARKGFQGGPARKRKGDDEGANADGGGSPVATKKARANKKGKGKADGDAADDVEANGDDAVKDEPAEDGV